MFSVGLTCEHELPPALLSRDWAGLKWHPAWEQLQGKHSEEMQNSYRSKPLAILM